MHLSFLLMFHESKVRRYISKLALMLASWKLLRFAVKLMSPKARNSCSIEDTDTDLLIQKIDNIQTEVDLIISAFRFEPHLETLRINILQLRQKVRVNFVFVLSQPSLNEKLAVLKLCEDLPNVTVLCSSKKTTIYESWNIAIKNSSSPVISNLNVDDIRNPECIAIALDAIKDNDVVYSDFYLSNRPIVDWAGFRSNGELIETSDFSVSRLVLDRFNYPHAAPFWRRKIHDEHGFFDSSMKSSGDTEFWLRLLLEGVRFKRIPKALYGYYENPLGLSTNSASFGRLEWAQVLEINHEAIREALKKDS